MAALRKPISPRLVGPIERALTGLGASFDEAMVRLWMRGDALRDVRDPALRDRIERAHAFYRNPVFLTDPETFFAAPGEPAAVTEERRGRLRRGDCVDLTFPTGFEPVFAAARDDFGRHAENTVVHARWWRHADRGRPTVLCLHGYASGNPRVDALAFGARRLYRAGYDVVLYTLPFHWRRMPRGASKSGEAFFDRDPARVNEAFAQTIFEARALMRHLAAAGAGPIGAFGMSLGAYATALLAAVERELAFAIAMIPVASLSELVWGEPLHRFRRLEVEANGLTLDRLRELWQVHAPLMRPPVVDRARRFVVGALGDRICPPGHAHALWNHWGRPRVHWYPGGHLAQFRRGRALAEVRAFLGSLALAPA